MFGAKILLFFARVALSPAGVPILSRAGGFGVNTPV